ncbi:MAG: hypothetical protein WC517_04290 [Patescibacteria group bacterium]
MDPNLLPEDLRNKEEQEQAKLKKQPAGIEIELSLPEPDRAEKELRGGSWIGSVRPPAKPMETMKLTEPARESVGAQEIDLLSAGKSIKKAAPAPVAKQKKNKAGWLAGLFGRPVSPIVDFSRANDPIIKPAAIRQAAAYSETAAGLKESVKIKDVWPADKLPRREISAHQPADEGDGWWEIFKGLFGGGHKKRVDFRSAMLIPEVIAPKTAPAKEAEPGKKIEPKPAQSEAGSPAYHLADKREKTSEVNINFLPRELAIRFKDDGNRTTKQLIIAVLLPVMLITLGYAAVLLLQNDLKAELSARQQEFDGLENQIGDFIVREKQNNLLADRIAVIKKLLAEKIIWNNFFDKLEKYTLDGVYYSSLTADASGALILPGVAADYDVLARQLAVFQSADDFLQSAKLINAQLVSDNKAGVIGVGFQLRLTLQDDLFKRIAQAE